MQDEAEDGESYDRAGYGFVLVSRDADASPVVSAKVLDSDIVLASGCGQVELDMHVLPDFEAR
eukprot:9125608-Karenia_brevis.AAC.1